MRSTPSPSPSPSARAAKEHAEAATAYAATLPAEGEAPALAPPVLPEAVPVPPAAPVSAPPAPALVPPPATADGIDLGFIRALGSKFVDGNCNEFNPVGFNRCCESSVAGRYGAAFSHQDGAAE